MEPRRLTDLHDDIEEDPRRLLIARLRGRRLSWKQLQIINTHTFSSNDIADVLVEMGLA